MPGFASRKNEQTPERGNGCRILDTERHKDVNLSPSTICASVHILQLLQRRRRPQAARTYGAFAWGYDYLAATRRIGAYAPSSAAVAER